jgi:hypothetical protein
MLDSVIFPPGNGFLTSGALFEKKLNLRRMVYYHFFVSLPASPENQSFHTAAIATACKEPNDTS